MFFLPRSGANNVMGLYKGRKVAVWMMSFFNFSCPSASYALLQGVFVSCNLQGPIIGKHVYDLFTCRFRVRIIGVRNKGELTLV